MTTQCPTAQSDSPCSLSLSYGVQRCGGAQPDEQESTAAMADGARDLVGRAMAASTAYAEGGERSGEETSGRDIGGSTRAEGAFSPGASS